MTPRTPPAGPPPPPPTTPPGPPGPRGPRPGCMPAYALLDNIRSAWNVGSMFRTADAAGLSGLYLCGMTATPPRTDLEKTALGSSVSVPWDYWADSTAAVHRLRDAGVQVVAVEVSPEAAPYDGFAYRFPVCFVVGHEVGGVRSEILAAADATVAIPMWGRKDSLNVAVSFGILVFELRRRWQVLGA